MGYLRVIKNIFSTVKNIFQYVPLKKTFSLDLHLKLAVKKKTSLWTTDNKLQKNMQKLEQCNMMGLTLNAQASRNKQ